MWLPFGLICLIVGIGGQSFEDLLPDQPSVTIAQGTVQGSLSANRNYAEFYGIPYADATSGNHRFKAPNPAPRFQDTFVANRKNIKCVRALEVGYEGTEDCLVTDVFTTSLNDTKNLPVMVWVKGKEFDQVNEPEISFGNFVEKDVVVVSLNYRESVLGFLCLGTETAPGNAGLKDIVAGLRWVKENIAQFGGNPDEITLVGHGSGAAAVDLVTLSPMASGLVNMAIIQSGSALSPWAVTRDNLKYAVEVAEALGQRVTDIEDLSEIFTRTSVEALMGVINDLDLTDNSLAFAPCIERASLENSVPFLLRSPNEILSNGEFTPIPIIIGYVDNEGTIRSEEAIERDWMSRMDESFEEFLPPDLEFENSLIQAQEAQKIRTQYFQNNPIDANSAENYINYHGDTMILVSALKEVRYRVIASNSPVYLYQFSYKGSLGEPFMGPLAVNSAAHSEELAYMFFDNMDTVDNQIPERDLAIGDILVERWTNFVKTGTPVSETSQVFWHTFTAIQPNFLRILNNNEIIEESTLEVSLQNPHASTMTFWDEIYAEHFLDADSQWEWNDGNEDGEGSGDGNGAGSGDGSGDGSEDGSGDAGGGATDSASTAVAYTFSIIALFAIVNEFHLFQVLS